MRGAPVHCREAEVEIAQRAGDRDGADRGFAFQRVGLGLELGEHVLDLLGLALSPVGPALVLGPGRALIARQDRGIEEPVGHRLKPERHPSLTALARNELAASVLAVELLADHRRIEEVHTLDRERRDLAMGLCSTTSVLGTTGETVTFTISMLRSSLVSIATNPDLAGVGR